MPPIKKYDSAFPPAPAKIEAKKALETAADKASEVLGRTVKPAALLRQIVLEWLEGNGFFCDAPVETEDIVEFYEKFDMRTLTSDGRPAVPE